MKSEPLVLRQGLYHDAAEMNVNPSRALMAKLQTALSGQAADSSDPKVDKGADLNPWSLPRGSFSFSYRTT